MKTTLNIVLLAIFSCGLVSCSTQHLDLAEDGNQCDNKLLAENIEFVAEDIEAIWAEYIQSATRIKTAPRSLDGVGRLVNRLFGEDVDFDFQAGESMLEVFGTSYMPNAYALYQETRAKAQEKEQSLMERFPDGKPGFFGDEVERIIYDKMAKALAKDVAEYFRRRDELCHFYLRHKANILSDAELAELDIAKIYTLLPLVNEVVLESESEETGLVKKLTEVEFIKLAEAERIFAGKYLPETLAAYDRLSNLLSDGKKQFDALCDDARNLDIFSLSLTGNTLSHRLNAIRSRHKELAYAIKDDRRLYALEEKTSDQLAAEDAERGRKFQEIEKVLAYQTFVKSPETKAWENLNLAYSAFRESPVRALPMVMVPIPGKNYAICRFEVTNDLWSRVMGDRWDGMGPARNVTWNECQEFLRRLNALPEVKASGAEYRLPTDKEWEYACRAGSTGDYCRLSDGTDITRATLKKVAWYGRDYIRWSVGHKTPNAFGLFDMHGNVWEWTSTAYRSGFVIRGGGSQSSANDCTASSWSWKNPNAMSMDLGFRLARTLPR